MSRMLEAIKEYAPQRTIEQAMIYAARGNVQAIEMIYRKIVGN